MQLIGERIKAIRNEAKLTQSSFADRIGIKQNSIAQIEGGNRVPSETVIKAICREFFASYDWLTNGVEPMHLPQEEAANFKLERLMKGDNEFVKSVFRELADLPTEAWEEIEALIDRIIANKKNRP